MDEKLKQELVNRLKRLVLADQCFSQVIALNDHLRDQEVTKHHPAYTAFVTGIAVTYMKPFTQSKGLGVLATEFSKFGDALLQHTHNLLKEARHKIYAHRDIDAATLLKYDDAGDTKPYEITVQLVKGQSPTFHVNIPEFPPELGYAVRGLCVFQKERAAKQTNDTISRLCNSEEYKVGHYVLGENFP